MSQNDSSVNFMYGNAFGRLILKVIQKTHADKLAVWFLRSSCSRGMMKRYVKKHNVPLTEEQVAAFRSYHEFFIRTRDDLAVDTTPDHLISPCDGYLSAYTIGEDSAFAIKGSHYRLEDLLEDDELAKTFHGGDCLIFRLCASDYHHYCYIDDGSHGKHRYIEGVLHSVQPIACETYPVYTLNRRTWTLLNTDHFGPVVQTEVGALVVGGIANEKEEGTFKKGEEKGHFELMGSTIVCLLQKGAAELLPDIAKAVVDEQEYRVTYGMHIGDACNQ